MNPYYPRHWGIGFGKGGAGLRRPLSQEYCLNFTVKYRKIEKYDKIAKKRIFIVDYFIAPLRGSNLGSRLRCCAATPRQALARAITPSNSDLSGCFSAVFV